MAGTVRLVCHTREIVPGICIVQDGHDRALGPKSELHDCFSAQVGIVSHH